MTAFTFYDTVELNSMEQDLTKWYIDIGPFFDRFGPVKYAILSSTDPIVQALVKDLQIRKWVDLKNTNVKDGIDLLITLAVPGVTTTLRDTILTTPPTPEENMALRKLYFS